MGVLRYKPHPQESRVRHPEASCGWGDTIERIARDVCVEGIEVKGRWGDCKLIGEETGCKSGGMLPFAWLAKRLGGLGGNGERYTESLRGSDHDTDIDGEQENTDG